MVRHLFYNLECVGVTTSDELGVIGILSTYELVANSGDCVFSRRKYVCLPRLTNNIPVNEGR